MKIDQVDDKSQNLDGDGPADAHVEGRPHRHNARDKRPDPPTNASSPPITGMGARNEANCGAYPQPTRRRICSLVVRSPSDADILLPTKVSSQEVMNQPISEVITLETRATTFCPFVWKVNAWVISLTSDAGSSIHTGCVDGERRCRQRDASSQPERR